MSPKSKQSNLVYSPGFGRSFGQALVAQLALGAACYAVEPVRYAVMGAFDFVHSRLMFQAHSWELWTVFGLLSSSCCLLQLLLNLMSVGCAGFNTVLGPLRPFFLALSFGSFALGGFRGLDRHEVGGDPMLFLGLIE